MWRKKRKSETSFLFHTLRYSWALYSLDAPLIEWKESKRRNKRNEEKSSTRIHIHETTSNEVHRPFLYRVVRFVVYIPAFYACTANEMRSIPMMLGRTQNNRYCNLHITLDLEAKARTRPYSFVISSIFLRRKHTDKKYSSKHVYALSNTLHKW